MSNIPPDFDPFGQLNQPDQPGRFCPSCGSAVGTMAAFCPHCGVSLQATPFTAPPATPRFLIPDNAKTPSDSGSGSGIGANIGAKAQALFSAFGRLGGRDYLAALKDAAWVVVPIFVVLVGAFYLYDSIEGMAGGFGAWLRSAVLALGAGAGGWWGLSGAGSGDAGSGATGDAGSSSAYSLASGHFAFPITTISVALVAGIAIRAWRAERRHSSADTPLALVTGFLTGAIITIVLLFLSFLVHLTFGDFVGGDISTAGETSISLLPASVIFGPLVVLGGVAAWSRWAQRRRQVGGSAVADIRAKLGVFALPATYGLVSVGALLVTSAIGVLLYVLYAVIFNGADSASLLWTVILLPALAVWVAATAFGATLGEGSGTRLLSGGSGNYGYLASNHPKGAAAFFILGALVIFALVGTSLIVRNERLGRPTAVLAKQIPLLALSQGVLWLLLALLTSVHLSVKSGTLGSGGLNEEFALGLLLTTLLAALWAPVCVGLGWLLAPLVERKLPRLANVLAALPPQQQVQDQSQQQSAMPQGVIPSASSLRARAIGLAVVGVLIAGVAAVAIINAVLASSSNPDQAVTSFLNDLQRGKANAAFSSLDATFSTPNNTGAPASFDVVTPSRLATSLKDPATNAAAKSISNITILDTLRNGNQATVSASWSTASGRQQFDFSLVSHDHQTLFFHQPSWKIEVPRTSVHITRPEMGGQIDFDGVSLPENVDTVLALGILPNHVTMEATDILAPIDMNVNGESVELTAKVKPEAVTAVLNAVQRQLDACVAQTIMAPPGCPFSDYGSGDTQTDVHWMLSPSWRQNVQVTRSYDGRGLQVSGYSSGALSVSYSYTSTYSNAGPQSTTDRVTLSINAQATFKGGEVTISTSQY